MQLTLSEIIQIIRDAALRYGLDAAIGIEQARQESGFNPSAIGPATRFGTAKGLFQFIDATAKEYGLNNPFDARASAEAWGRYMRDLLNRYGHDYSKALAAYNWGPGNLNNHLRDSARYPKPAETRNYVQKILERAGLANRQDVLLRVGFLVLGALILSRLVH